MQDMMTCILLLTMGLETAEGKGDSRPGYSEKVEREADIFPLLIFHVFFFFKLGTLKNK